MIDPMLIGRGAPPKPLNVWLGWNRFEALADYFIRLDGGLESERGLCSAMPAVVKTLPACDQWPERVLIEHGAA